MKRRRLGALRSSHLSSGTSGRRAGSVLLPSQGPTAPPPEHARRPPRLPPGPWIRLRRGRMASRRLQFAWGSRPTRHWLKPPRPQRGPHHQDERLLPATQATARHGGRLASGLDRPLATPLRVGGSRLSPPGLRQAAAGGRVRSPEEDRFTARRLGGSSVSSSGEPGQQWHASPLRNLPRERGLTSVEVLDRPPALEGYGFGSTAHTLQKTGGRSRTSRASGISGCAGLVPRLSIRTARAPAPCYVRDTEAA